MPLTIYQRRERALRYFLFTCLWLLAGSGFVSGLNAADCSGSPCFQWSSIKGIDAHWEGWDIHAGGQIVVDAVAYDKNNRKNSGLRWETVNLRVTGNRGDRFRFFVEPDLLGIDTRTNLYEAWAAWNINPSLLVRAGQVKVALNSEFATRPENCPCLDYGFSSYLDGRYDLGLQADGLLPGKVLWYEATATTGNGFDLDGRRRSDPLCALRAVVFPQRFIPSDFLDGAFAGLGLAWSPDYDDSVLVQTPLRSTVFTTRPLHGDYYRSWHFEAGYYKGPFRIGAERVNAEIGNVRIGGGRTIDVDQLTSWSAYASWNITGERMRWERGRWLPARGDNKRLKGLERIPGCLELAFRYSNADLDRVLFETGMTAYDPSTQEVRTATLNMNWYPRPGLKVSAGWVSTIADHELYTLGGTNRDSSYVIRAGLVL